MNYEATIGKNFDTTLKYINDASKSEWFVPEANDTMDCGALQRYADQLTQQVAMWNDKIINSGNRKEIENLGKIMENQEGKLSRYEAKINTKCIIQDTPTTTETPTTTTTTGKNTWIWIAGAALIAYLLFKKQ